MGGNAAEPAGTGADRIPDRVRHVRIVPLPLATLRALAEGDLAAAQASSPVPLSEAFVDPPWRIVWRWRCEQVRADPRVRSWVTGVVWDVDAGRAVGRAGFHAPPDAHGLVEVGYAMTSDRRHQGYGRATLAALLERAAAEPAVHVVRASISPDNEPSLGLIALFPFSHVGEQWDAEDGRELVFELAV